MLQKLIHRAGHRAGKGAYWDISSGQRVALDREGILPGGPTTRYIRAHGAVVLLLGPVLGLLYAVFLPFIGIAMTLSLVAKKISRGLSSAAAGSVSFGWRPVEAYLTGRKRRTVPEEKRSKNIVR